MTIWQRKRVKRVQEEVIPRVKEYMEEAKYELRAQFRRAGKDYAEYTKELNKRVCMRSVVSAMILMLHSDERPVQEAIFET